MSLNRFRFVVWSRVLIEAYIWKIKVENSNGSNSKRVSTYLFFIWTHSSISQFILFTHLPQSLLNHVMTINSYTFISSYDLRPSRYVSNPGASLLLLWQVNGNWSIQFKRLFVLDFTTLNDGSPSFISSFTFPFCKKKNEFPPITFFLFQWHLELISFLRPKCVVS